MPTFLGVLKQGRNWGLIFGITATEEEFLDPNNRQRFELCIRRLQRISRLSGTDTISLAGILPSHLDKLGILDGRPSAEKSASAIVSAVSKVIETEFGGNSVPVILLGGNGLVGRSVRLKLEREGHQTRVVDPTLNVTRLPEDLHGNPAVLLDISRRAVIDTYVDQLWPEIVLLNETYPEPSRSTLRRLKSNGVKILHISGVQGFTKPALPFGYADAVPCCAIHDAACALTPVIKRL